MKYVKLFYFALMIMFLSIFGLFGFSSEAPSSRHTSTSSLEQVPVTSSTTNNNKRPRNKIANKVENKIYSVIPHVWMNTDNYFNFAFDFTFSIKKAIAQEKKTVDKISDFIFALHLKRETFMESVKENEFTEDKLVTATDVVAGEFLKLRAFNVNFYNSFSYKNYEKKGKTSLFEYDATVNTKEFSLICDVGIDVAFGIFEFSFFGGFIPYAIVYDTGKWDVKGIGKFSYNDRKYKSEGYNIISKLKIDFFELRFKMQWLSHRVESSGHVVERASGLFPFIAQTENYKTSSMDLSFVFVIESMNLGTKQFPMYPGFVFSFKKNDTLYETQPGTSSKRFDIGMEFRY